MQTVESANDAAGAGCASECKEKTSLAEDTPVMSSDESLSSTNAKESASFDDNSSVANEAVKNDDNSSVQQSAKPPRPMLEIPHFKVQVYRVCCR